MIQLIGIDVDGTLLDSAGRFPPANRAAIQAAVEAGVHVALVTGRSYPFARPVADGLPDTVTLIVSNGAVERGMDGATRARRLLDKNVARTVLGANAGHRASTALVFDRDVHGQIVFETMDWTHPGRKGYWARNKALIARSVPLEDALVEDPIQVMFNGGFESMRVLADEIRGQVAFLQQVRPEGEAIHVGGQEALDRFARVADRRFAADVEGGVYEHGAARAVGEGRKQAVQGGIDGAIDRLDARRAVNVRDGGNDGACDTQPRLPVGRLGDRHPM